MSIELHIVEAFKQFYPVEAKALEFAPDAYATMEYYKLYHCFSLGYREGQIKEIKLNTPKQIKEIDLNSLKCPTKATS